MKVALLAVALVAGCAMPYSEPRRVSAKRDPFRDVITLELKDVELEAKINVRDFWLNIATDSSRRDSTLTVYSPDRGHCRVLETIIDGQPMVYGPFTRDSAALDHLTLPDAEIGRIAESVTLELRACSIELDVTPRLRQELESYWRAVVKLRAHEPPKPVDSGPTLDG